MLLNRHPLLPWLVCGLVAAQLAAAFVSRPALNEITVSAGAVLFAVLMAPWARFACRLHLRAPLSRVAAPATAFAALMVLAAAAVAAAAGGQTIWSVLWVPGLAAAAAAAAVIRQSRHHALAGPAGGVPRP